MADKIVSINSVIKHYNAEMVDDLRSGMRDDVLMPAAKSEVGQSMVYIFEDLSYKLRLFPCLGVKKDYALKGYIWDYRLSMGEEEGVVWAMPENTLLPDNPTHIGYKPPEARDNIMEVIEGDGSLWSYLCASVFSRTMADFGLSGHSLTLEMGYIIGNDFRQSPEDYRRLDDFEWHEPRPLNFDPEVKRENNIITVTLHTYKDYAPGKLTRFVDVYNHGNYCFKREETVIAEDGGILCL